MGLKTQRALCNSYLFVICHATPFVEVDCICVVSANFLLSFSRKVLPQNRGKNYYRTFVKQGVNEFQVVFVKALGAQKDSLFFIK